MIDVNALLRYKIVNIQKLIKYGFIACGDTYRKEIPCMEDQFHMVVIIEHTGLLHFKVIEDALDEEYILIHVEQAQGGFVDRVRKSCDEILQDIITNCYDTEILKAEQTKRTLLHMKQTYAVEPEYLWKKTPNNAVFRRDDNKKWFAIIQTVARHKLGLCEQGDVEIINLKAQSENITKYLAKDNYFSAYHMNKQHWFSICLDGSISDDELYALIAASYKLVA